MEEEAQVRIQFGKQDFLRAARIAAGCPEFVLDDEDELYADELTSCYNCRFRRWTAAAFICMKGPK